MNFDLINSIGDVRLKRDSDLTKYSTMRLSARGDLIEVDSVDALKELLPILKKNNKKYFLLGWGSNVLIKEKSDLLYIKLNFHGNDLTIIDGDEFDLPASFPLNAMTSFALKKGLKGWEVFTGIPASVGGAIYMNAGTNLGEICEIVKSVEYVTSDGELKSHIVTSDSFSYRRNNFLSPGDVIVSATFVHHGIDPKISTQIKEYLELRKKTQPLNKFTCGCIFKNYKSDEKTCPAGKYIDMAGLKGFEHKGLRVSPVHGNFIENISGATYQDVIELIDIIKNKLKEEYGLDFELEVKL